MKTIVKYSNRKLYDKNTNSYVTLRQLIEKVRNNQSFTVVEHKTNKDITNDTLKSALSLVEVSNDVVLDLIKVIK